MKVVYMVSGIGPPAASGTEYIQSLIFSLSKNGVDATIISPIYIHTKPGWKKWIKGQEEKYKVQIIYISVPAIIQKNYFLHLAITPVITTVALFRLLLHGKYDLIHEFTSSPVILFRAYLMKLFFKTSTVLTLSVYNNTFLGGLFWLKFLNFAEYYLIPSKELIGRISDLGVNSKKLIYSPPGINLSLYKRRSRVAARRELGLPNGMFIFSYFGPMTIEKGVIDLLEASRMLNKTISKKILIAIYSHPLLKLKTGTQVRDRVVSSGLSFLTVHEKEIDIPSLLAASDCVILPQQSGHGTTVPPISTLEAAASGTPIIATDIIGNREWVSSNGILVDPKSPSKLAAAIVELYKNRTLVTKHAKKNRSRLKNLSHKKSIALHLSLYQKFLK